MEPAFAVQNFRPSRLVCDLIDDQGVAKAVRPPRSPYRFYDQWRRPHEENDHVMAEVKSQAVQRCHAGGNADGWKVDVARFVSGQHVWRQGRNALGENALAQV